MYFFVTAVQSLFILIFFLFYFVQHDTSGFHEVALGGGIYIAGVFFFKCDGVIPFAHAVWHCFVFLGALIHFSAICKYLLIPGPSSSDIISTHFTG